jgi:hypothetical protein
MELAEVAKAAGFDAEVRVDLTAADPIPDAKPQQSEEDKKLFVIKASAICCLIVQNCAQALTMKYANGEAVVDTEGHKYLATTVVVMVYRTLNPARTRPYLGAAMVCTRSQTLNPARTRP